MENYKIKKQVKGFGLIEAILAIAVAGIACLVFLQIAFANWTDVVQVEQSDKIAKESIKTAQQVRNIVDEHNARESGDDRLFPVLSQELEGKCSRIAGTLETPTFYNADLNECTLSDIRNCKDNSSGEYYSIYCVDNVDTSAMLVEGKVISGLKSCLVKEDAGKVCNIPEFDYIVISRLRD